MVAICVLLSEKEPFPIFETNRQTQIIEIKTNVKSYSVCIVGPVHNSTIPHNKNTALNSYSRYKP